MRSCYEAVVPGDRLRIVDRGLPPKSPAYLEYVVVRLLEESAEGFRWLVSYPGFETISGSVSTFSQAYIVGQIVKKTPNSS